MTHHPTADLPPSADLRKALPLLYPKPSVPSQLSSFPPSLGGASRAGVRAPESRHCPLQPGLTLSESTNLERFATARPFPPAHIPQFTCFNLWEEVCQIPRFPGLAEPHCQPSSHVHTQTFVIARKSFPRIFHSTSPQLPPFLSTCPSASLQTPMRRGCFPSHSHPFQVLVSIFQHLSFLTFQQPSLQTSSGFTFAPGRSCGKRKITCWHKLVPLKTCDFQWVGYTQQRIKLTWGASFSTAPKRRPYTFTHPRTPPRLLSCSLRPGVPHHFTKCHKVKIFAGLKPFGALPLMVAVALNFSWPENHLGSPSTLTFAFPSLGQIPETCTKI